MKPGQRLLETVVEFLQSSDSCDSSCSFHPRFLLVNIKYQVWGVQVSFPVPEWNQAAFLPALLRSNLDPSAKPHGICTYSTNLGCPLAYRVWPLAAPFEVLVPYD